MNGFSVCCEFSKPIFNLSRAFGKILFLRNNKNRNFECLLVIRLLISFLNSGKYKVERERERNIFYLKLLRGKLSLVRQKFSLNIFSFLIKFAQPSSSRLYPNLSKIQINILIAVPYSNISSFVSPQSTFCRLHFYISNLV